MYAVSRAHRNDTVVWNRSGNHRGKILCQWDMWVWVLWDESLIPASVERHLLLTESPITLADMED